MPLVEYAVSQRLMCKYSQPIGVQEDVAAAPATRIVRKILPHLLDLSRAIQFVPHY